MEIFNEKAGKFTITVRENDSHFAAVIAKNCGKPGFKCECYRIYYKTEYKAKEIALSEAAKMVEILK